MLLNQNTTAASNKEIRRPLLYQNMTSAVRQVSRLLKLSRKRKKSLHMIYWEARILYSVTGKPAKGHKSHFGRNKITQIEEYHRIWHNIQVILLDTSPLRQKRGNRARTERNQLEDRFKETMGQNKRKSTMQP